MLADLSEAAGHQQLLKGINRMSLVRHLCAHPGLSRADLAGAVQLTKSTVSLLVRELIDEGWLVEHEVVATGDLGRRPTPLFIDPHRLALVGAEVGIDGVRVVATSLSGEIMDRATASFGASRGAKACMGTLATALLKVHRRLDAATQRVIGVGVGLPGGVDEANAMLRFAPNLQWRDVPVGKLLADKLAGTGLAGVPLFVQNEADVAAVGEMEFNPGEMSDPLLYLSIDEGVGAGVIVGDRLLLGSRGFAGEVGHMVLEVGGPLCSCGRRGCAEALIGARALLSASAAGTPAAWRRRLAAHDPELQVAVKRAATYLGVLLQNLASAYDPGCIVLGGSVVELGDELLQPALQTLSEFCAAAGLSPPQVRKSHFGSDAVAVGGAALARYRLTRPLLSPAFAGGRVVVEQEAA